MRTLCLACCCWLGSLVLAPTARAGEGSNATVGEVRLASGLLARCDYHFDRNAFAASVDLPGGLVALTRSGNLLRFDRETFKLNREWFGPSRATCLGTGENGQALVGFDDGRIARLDPSNLALTTIGQLPGKVRWIGVKKGDGKGIVAAVERWRWFDVTSDGLGQEGFRDLPPDDRLEPELRGMRRKTGIQNWMPESVVFDLNSGKSCPIGGRGQTVFFDSKNRLWFGYEMGEFGGWCRCVDASGAQPKLVRSDFDPANGDFPLNDCIYGFVEPKDGRIWALGGVMHGFGSIAIYRVDGEKVETPLNLHGEPFIDLEKAFGPKKPDSPLVWMVQEAKPGSFLGISEDGTLYRTDKELKVWERLRSFDDDIRFSNAYSESGGVEPTIRDVHDRGGKLLIATASDGYVRVEDDGVKKNLIPDQLEANKIEQIVLTPVGPLFRDEGEKSPWQSRDGRWTHEPLVLPIEGLSEDPDMFVGPDGSIYATAAREILRFQDGKVETLANQLPPPESSSWAMPDGKIWAIQPGVSEDRIHAEENPNGRWPERKPGSGSLFRLASGKWEKAVDLPGIVEQSYLVTETLEGGEMIYGYGIDARKTRKANGDGYPYPLNNGKSNSIGRNLHVINSMGPRWVVHDRDTKQLFSLDLDPARPAPGFALLRVEEAGLPLKVYDAIAWSREEVLIATRKGSKLCEITTGKIRPAPLPAPDRPVKRLARDGLKRIWLGGEGLWMVDAENRLHDLAELPMVGRSTVSALALDPSKQDGVIVALESRGVAFLRVEAGAGR